MTTTSTRGKFFFEASAHLQTLLGRELITGEELAIIELVKNAYDSGAKSVSVTIRPPSAKEPGEIIILDDGGGMGLDQFERSFMFAGYSTKTAAKGPGGRTQTGEKGIGAFAADRLGATLTVLTKTRSDPNALRVDIDWKGFDDRTKRFGDVSAPYKEVPPPSELERSGTMLSIRSLRQSWERSRLEGLKSAMSQLLDPYAGPADFAIDLQVVGSPKISGQIHRNKIKNSDIQIDFKINEKGVATRRIGGTLYGNKLASAKKQPAYKAKELRGLHGRFFYFINRPRKEDTEGALSGVQVFRDGFRIEPMGSGRADWLGIEEQRAKRAGHAHIVPSRLFGFVSISRATNPGLRDTTSREALVESPAVQELLDTLKDELEFLAETIQVDVAEPRWKESRTKQALALEQARLQSLSILSSGLGHEMRQPLQSIRMEAENISLRLQQLGIGDPDITAAQQSIDNGIRRIDRNINLIASIATGDLAESETLDAAEVVKEQTAFLASRCASKGIELNMRLPSGLAVKSNETLIGIVLINLIQNSIEAFQNTSDDRKKKIITVSTFRAHASSVGFKVEDNAGGIPKSIIPKIFKRFTTQKTGGWGVGLYNCKLFLESHGGTISFDTKEGKGTTFTFTLPKAVG